MSNFKCGDFVKVITSGYASSFTGMLDVVSKINLQSDYPIQVDFPKLSGENKGWPFAEDELEPVS
jgi:hypothetical protein